MCRSANPLSRLLLLLALAGLVSASAAPTTAKRRYELTAGNASTTLRQFVEQSGEQVLYVVPRVRDVTTNAVKGEFTAREVLDLMLKGTTLVVVEDTKTGALMINRAPEPKAAEPPHKTNRRNEPQDNSMITTNRRKNPLAWLGALFALTFAQTTAQTTTTTEAPAPLTPSKGEVIELSPFVVTADEDEGYQASNTLAGSRMATSLRDTAASVSVLTAELLADIGAISLDEAIAFATNVELDHDQINNDNATFENFNTYRIRGQAANIGRNYFRWYVPSDTYNVERIEEARGPNSVLFGIASAGGMLSSQTKQANTNRDFQNLSLVTGSYNMYRAVLDVNQASANKKFGVRLNAVYSDAKGFKHHAFDESKRYHLAVKYNLTPNTILRAEYERGTSNTNRTNNQMLGDNVQRWVAAGSPVMVVTATNNALGITRLGTGVGNGMVTPNEVSPGVFEFIDMRGQGVAQGLGGGLLAEPFYDPRNFRASSGGPDQLQASESDTWSAFIDHRLFKNTHMQLAYNHQEYVFDGWQARLNANLNADPNKFLRDGVTPNPNAGKYYFEGQWTRYYREGDSDNLRFSVSQELHLGKWGEYRLAGLAEREESREQRGVVGGAEHWFDETTGRGAFNSNPAASANRVIRRHYIDLNDQSTWFHGFTNPATSGLLSGVPDPSNPNRTLGSVLLGGASQYDDPTEQDTFLLSGQGYYFKRKLVVAGGYRWDTLYQHEGFRGKTDSVGRFILPGPDDPVTNRTSDSKTRTYGVVYHVLPWLSLRYNNSNSYELPDARQRLMPHPGPNGEFIGYRQGESAQGDGEDYGFDLTLLDGRIHVRATRFNTTRVGFQRNGFSGFDSPMTLSSRVLTALEDAGAISTAEHDLHRIDINGSTGDMASKGDELSITTNVTKNWRLTANYSNTTLVSDNLAPEIKRWAEIEIPYYQKFDQNIIVANTGQTIGFEIADWLDSLNNVAALEGVAALGTRKHKVSFVSRYSFRDGLLKGLSVGGSATHQSKNIVGIRTSGDLVYGNSITTLGASLNYGIKQVPGLKFLKNLGIQLNVYNLLDTRDPMIIRYLNNNADPLQVIRMAARAPRTWRLSANMSF